MTTPIPSPPQLPFLGNITALDRELPIRSFELLADQYGELYKLSILCAPVAALSTCVRHADSPYSAHDAHRDLVRAPERALEREAVQEVPRGRRDRGPERARRRALHRASRPFPSLYPPSPLSPLLLPVAC